MSMTPNSTGVTLRPELAASLEEFDVMAAAQGYIATQAMPVIDVMKQNGTFGKIPVEQMLKQVQTTRAPGAGYHRSDAEFETDTFATEEHGHEEIVDDREAKLYADYLDAEMVAARRIQGVLGRDLESAVASALFNATTFSGFTSGVNDEWDDSANAVPVKDVNTAVKNVYDQSGLVADTLIISWKTFRDLLVVEDIIDRLKYNGVMDVSMMGLLQANKALGQIFGLPKVLVGGAVYNSANEGAAKSLAGLWSEEYALICKTANSNDFREPCVGRLFQWREDGAAADSITMESYRDDTVRGTVIRGRTEYDVKVLYPEAGYLLSNITT